MVGAFRQEPGGGEDGIEVGSGEAKGRRGGRAAATDPGELFGEEGWVLGDEIAELYQSFHGGRERERGGVEREKRLEMFGFLHSGLGKQTFWDFDFGFGFGSGFCFFFVFWLGWEGDLEMKGGSIVGGLGWLLTLALSSFVFSLIIRHVFVACVSEVQAC